MATNARPFVIAYGCLLIPVAIGVWWYWTRRTATKFRVAVSGLLTPESAKTRGRTSTSVTTVGNDDDDDSSAVSIQLPGRKPNGENSDDYYSFDHPYVSWINSNKDGSGSKQSPLSVAEFVERIRNGVFLFSQSSKPSGEQQQGDVECVPPCRVGSEATTEGTENSENQLGGMDLPVVD